MNRLIKWGLALLFGLLLAWFGFTYTVREGSSAIHSRFGRVIALHTDAGLQLKLPWPIDKITLFDMRYQYLDSGLTETLTQDKKNIILQTYMVWKIEDPVRFYTRIGSAGTASAYLADLLANAKNGVMGNYMLSALVSTNEDDIKISDIESEIMMMTAPRALANYGVSVKSIQIERLALPTANVESVFEQMRADRQKSVSQLISEGERDASILRSQADSEAAQIIADGLAEAAAIDADTETQSAAIYADAYMKNPELFTLLKKLTTLESAANEKTVLVIDTSESPFGILLDAQE
ncbi:MAG: protease modulator HflC [Oscillospiraceae bacterium]|jgi:membrane protease subunit HflC|nr:protease modulator HflC [Oscillospiraceae bacterium]